MSFSKVQSLCQENLKVKVIIFNHTEFLEKRKVKHELSRHGHLGDQFENCMKDVLQDYAEITHIKDNKELVASTLLENMHKVSNNGSPYSGLVVFVSSHGSIGTTENKSHFEVIKGHDKYYHKSELWKCFAGKAGWKGKPLLFFYQACRGSDATVGVPMTFDASSESNELEEHQSNTQMMSNLFVFNATQPGAKAGRTMPEGSSKFLDDLCDTFTRHARTTDLCSMAVMICGSVAEDFENCPEIQPPLDSPPGKMDCSMQMPSFESKLEMKLYLTKDYQPQVNIDEQFFASNDSPTVLFLNYSDGDINRIKRDTELLTTYFLNNGYNCLEKWDASYKQYKSLIKTHFDHKDKNAFFVIFNGSGSGSYVTIDETIIKLPKLWRPLLPDPTQNEPVVEKPKVFLFLGDSTRNSHSGAAAKFTKLYRVDEEIPNVGTCVMSLAETINNIPVTADLLLCFQNAHEERHVVTPFVEAFCQQIKRKEHKDILEVLTDTNSQLASSEHEAVIIFSTLRKLIPINNASGRIGKYTLLL